MIPKIIWQTYETDFDLIPDGAKEFVKTWKDNNPNWEYRYMSKIDRENFILKFYGQEWLDLFNMYTLNALRADLWRYLVLYKFGGLYADLDITCHYPVEKWINENDQFIISGEPGDICLTQMIIACVPGHPLLKKILDNVKETTIKNVQNNINYSSRVDYNRLTTGYIIVTNSIIEFLELPQNFNFAEMNYMMYNNKAKEFGIKIFSGENSFFLHENMIKHHRAGLGTLWKDYDSWLTMDWNNNE